MKRTRLRMRGTSETSVLKEEIQGLLREIVIKRDGGCILRGTRHCGGEIGEAVLQADHLITRGNSATFADHRLVVCLCRPCHGGCKKWHEKEYDVLVRKLLSEERIALWDRCLHESWRATSKRGYDWKLEVINLKSIVKRLRIR